VDSAASQKAISSRCQRERAASRACTAPIRGAGLLGSQLSGGEQQMLAIGRALIVNPRIVLLDEPTEGLAPIIVEELLGVLRNVIRNEGLSAIVVEQKARKILSFTDRAIVLDRGRIVLASDSQSLSNDPTQLETHLGVTEQKRPAAGRWPS